MRQRSLFFLITGVATLIMACTPNVMTTVSTPRQPLPEEESVQVLMLTEEAPSTAQVIGSVKIGDTGFSVDCGWSTVIETARREARKAGGNIVKITQHRMPDLMSTCHRITAQILYLSPANASPTLANSATPEPEQDVVTPAAVQEVQPSSQPQNSPVERPMMQSYRPESHFEVHLSGGWSNRIAKIANTGNSVISSHLKELKSGSYLQGNVVYYFYETVGIGAHYSSGRFHNTVNNIAVTLPDNSLIYTRMEDAISINYVGPVLSTKYSNDDQLFLRAAISMGLLNYKDEAYLGESFQLSGNTLGLVLSGGLDYFFSENVGFALQASLLRGALSSVELTTGYHTETMTLEEDEQENLSKLDLSLGLVFSF